MKHSKLVFLQKSVFELGVEWGYFQKSTIGSKEGLGRKLQYVLNRRLAPYFKIDPSGYAAYLSVTPEALELATKDTNKFIQQRSGIKEERQLGLI